MGPSHCGGVSLVQWKPMETLEGPNVCTFSGQSKDTLTKTKIVK